MTSLQGQLTEDDYLAALLLARRHNRMFKVVRTGLWVLIGVLSVAYVVVSLQNPRFAIQLLVLAAVAGVLLLERHVMLPLRARRIFRQQRSMQEPFEVSYDGDGVRWESAVTTRRLPWHYYVRWAEDARYFLLYQSDWTLEVLPKRFFGGDEQISAFRDLLGERITRSGNR
jgi:hypothetical protein